MNIERKRLFDVAVAAGAMWALSPALAAIALMVLVDSGGPVLFQQRRVGRYGKAFTLFKFRTMTRKRGADQGTFDLGDVSRVTRCGRWLRRFKLDELPQLYNVLKGDMSLVGPRPEVQRWVDVYPERWAKVHRVRPGLTDLASVTFVNEEAILADARDPEACYRNALLPRKLDHYERYVDDNSVAGDVKILGRTVLAILRA